MVTVDADAVDPPGASAMDSAAASTPVRTPTVQRARRSKDFADNMAPSPGSRCATFYLPETGAGGSMV
ncbi:hypothetical protein GCM10027273_04380 [Nocardioides pakistanensis]